MTRFAGCLSLNISRLARLSSGVEEDDVTFVCNCGRDQRDPCYVPVINVIAKFWSIGPYRLLCL